LGNTYIRFLWKKWMMLKFRAICLKINPIDIFYKKYSMGIADIHPNRILQRTDIDTQMQCVHFLRNWNRMPLGSKTSHPYGYCFVTSQMAIEFAT